MPGPPGGAVGEDAAVFVGFTAATTDGIAGGRNAMHSMCAAEFTDAHLCHASEYYLSNSATPPPVNGAWVDWSARWRDDTGSVYRVRTAGRYAGRYIAQDAVYDGLSCGNWTSTTYSGGINTYPAEALTITGEGATTELCTEQLQLACCATPMRESFAGYTTATETGDVGGRAIMHYTCATEYSGSHMCHAAEFYRAHPLVDPPLEGAWLDWSGQWRDDTGSVYRESSLAEYTASRYVADNAIYDGTSCGNWTSLTYSGGINIYDANGLTMTIEGPESQPCDEPRPLACCY